MTEVGTDNTGRDELHGGLDVTLQQTAPIPLDVRLRCGRSELLALVGPSGSGKTTVLRAIAGLLDPRAGRIVCNGTTWLDTAAHIAVSPQARRVGFVFQDYALFPHLTALDNVAIAVAGETQTGKHTVARDLIARVNLTGLEGRYPRELSGGQQQRIALARALARSPVVLLLDEPFAAVDQMTRERLKRELAALRRSLAIPIVMVTHDIAEALALADRLSVLHRGETLQSGTPDEVRLRPRTPNVARLIGETNVFRGVLEQPADGARLGRLRLGEAWLDIAATGGMPAGAEVQWMIPAEAIVLHRRGRPSHGERENPLPGIVLDVTGLGEQTAVTVQLAARGDAILNFRLPTHAARRNELAAGAGVTVSLLAGSLHLLMPDV